MKLSNKGSIRLVRSSWQLRYSVPGKDGKPQVKNVCFAKASLPLGEAMLLAERIMMPINAHWRRRTTAGKMIEKARRTVKRLPWETRIKMLEEQGRRCAICRTSDPGKFGWHYDHDHDTGAWRGVLCHHCNCGLGFLRENVQTMQAMIEYVLRHKTGSIWSREWESNPRPPVYETGAATN
jgi:hypothetical protein